MFLYVPHISLRYERSLMNCLWLPIRADYITTYYIGALRFPLLRSTPLLDSR
nr:MAG TPA: hypothetical protein [Caudoviricetes sp.]